MAAAIPEFTHDRPGTSAGAWRAHPSWAGGTPVDLAVFDRVVVVAAHPDDETLGAGGLMASCSERGVDVQLLCATAGEHSHPRSPTTSPSELAAIRRRELLAAAELLGLPPDKVHQGSVPDGALTDHVATLTSELVSLVGDGRRTLVVAPWRRDGHPDHAAAGTAAAAAAKRTGAELWEYPIWFWHWGEPATAPWQQLRPLVLGDAARRAKATASAAHVSQVAPLSSRPGDETLLSAEFLQHFADGPEHFVATRGADCEDEALDELHEQEPDPWGADTRWYERRKRDLVLAALPRARFRRTLELGSSTGALAEALAERSDAVLAVDSSTAAVRSARRRFEHDPAVTVTQLDLARDWPAGAPFDLVVVSEVGYFLSPVALESVVDHVRASLAADGVVVLVHWRHPVHGWVLDGEAVHRAFEVPDLPPLQATYRDRDVEIRVHARDDDWVEPTR